MTSVKLNEENRLIIEGWVNWRESMRAMHQEGIRVTEEQFWRTISLEVVKGTVRQSDVADVMGCSREYVRQRTIRYRIESAAEARNEQ